MRTYKQPRKERGLSSLGLLVILGLAAFFLLCAFKLIPLYLDSYFVQGSLNKLRDENLSVMTNTQIRDKIDRHFSIDGVRGVSVRDVKIKRDKDRVTLTLDYEKRINFLGNLDVVVMFENGIDTVDND